MCRFEEQNMSTIPAPFWCKDYWGKKKYETHTYIFLCESKRLKCNHCLRLVNGTTIMILWIEDSRPLPIFLVDTFESFIFFLDFYKCDTISI